MIFVATGGIEGMVSLSMSGIQGLKSTTNYIDDLTLKSYVSINSQANFYKKTLIKGISKHVWKKSSMSSKKWMIRNNVTSRVRNVYNTNYEFFGPKALEKYYKSRGNVKNIIELFK